MFTPVPPCKATALVIYLCWFTLCYRRNNVVNVRTFISNKWHLLQNISYLCKEIYAVNFIMQTISKMICLKCEKRFSFFFRFVSAWWRHCKFVMMCKIQWVLCCRFAFEYGILTLHHWILQRSICVQCLRLTSIKQLCTACPHEWASLCLLVCLIFAFFQLLNQ